MPDTRPRLVEVTDPSELHRAVAAVIAQRALVVTHSAAVINCSSNRTTRAEPIRP